MTPRRILLIGDSITVGYPTAQGFRGYLLDELTTRWPASSPPQYVSSTGIGPDAHEGHGGWTSGALANRAVEWIDAAQPDVVIVLAGTNDKADVNQTIRNLAKIAWVARQRGALVMVATLPHASLANDSIRRFAAQTRRQVRLVDLARAGVTLTDSVHPDDAGYRTIAKAIASRIPSPDRPVRGFIAMLLGIFGTLGLAALGKELAS